MKTYNIGNTAYRGESLREAFAQNFSKIIGTRLGNCAGYRLVSVRSEYVPTLFGHWTLLSGGKWGPKGGVRITIRHQGLPMASGCAVHTHLTANCPCEPPIQQASIDIECDPSECVEPMEFSIASAEPECGPFKSAICYSRD